VRGGDRHEQVLSGVAERVELGVARFAASLEMRGLGDLARARDPDTEAALISASVIVRLDLGPGRLAG
jgi:hypothetical protein